MLLNFSTKYPQHVTDRAGDPTFFVEQIGMTPRRKIHTIRERADRFKRPGIDKLHICTGSRTPAYILHRVMTYSGQQPVEITASREGGWHLVGVVIDGHELPTSAWETFWKNDGFYSEKDFCEWFFNDGAKNGTLHTISRFIIHFTDFRYVTGAV